MVVFMSLKSKVLEELEKNKDMDISGEFLAEKLGVSRNAVWKAVNSMRAEGYEISSGTNKGYKLEHNDIISSEGIKLHLTCGEIPVFAFKVTDSTNNEAKRMLANGFCGKAIIVSEEQTAGRGRQGRSFYSPAKTGIYMTLIINLETNLTNAALVTTMVAVSVVRAIKALTDKEPEIKWVNDIYLKGKKICGILTEGFSAFESGTSSVIVGIGINFNTHIFPEEIENIAASLNSSGINRNKLIAEITNNLIALTNAIECKDYLDEYRSYSMIIGRKINYLKNGETKEGEAVGIDDDGGLVVNSDGETKVLRSGEVKLIL